MKKCIRFLFEVSEIISPLFLTIFFTIFGFEGINIISYWFVVWLIIWDMYVLLDFSYTNDKWREYKND